MIFAITADQVVAGAAVIQAIVVLGGLWFARKQIKEAVATRKDQSRPYVAIYFEMTAGMESFPDLVVKNLGPTAAYNVVISTTPEIRSSTDREGELVLGQAGFLKNGIPTLPPGGEVRAFFDTMIGRPTDWELAYEATVSYQDRSSERHDDRYILDLSPHLGTSHVTRRTIHDVHKQLENLVKELKYLRTGFGSAMPIVVEERSEMIERNRREREERAVEMEQRKAKLDSRGPGQQGQQASPPNAGE